ncbi:hypothetical protein N0V93_007877 [Gnomoniopsis smithogilvyi]|uniref:Lipocalin-like domain-containing protein n=1 Tax=Gnomoniopsis smithogilvyi TaxID=1191159 RepID=A0A9W9CU77_9PEZI|nr:hypothetical protein N0V93_007877 [Gnomoniopsis smithogilvyi]
MVSPDPIFAAIAGVYALVNTTAFVNGTEVADRVYGSAPVGQLIYTADGFVSATITSTDPQDRPANLTFPFQDGQSDADWAAVGRHSIGYSGPFSINPDVPSNTTMGGVLHGPLTVANVPSMVGNVQPRNYTLIQEGEDVLLRIDSRRAGVRYLHPAKTNHKEEKRKQGRRAMESAAEKSLIEAATLGHLEQLRSLLAANPSPPADQCIQKLLTAAAWRSQLPIVQFLLESYSPNRLEEEAIRAAVYSGSIPLFSAFLSRDPSIINMPFDRRSTPLVVACMAQKPLDFLQFLLENGADPNSGPEDALPPPLWHVAALYKDPAAIDLLLEHGAKLEDAGGDALAIARKRVNEVMIQSLLERGANGAGHR